MKFYLILPIIGLYHGRDVKFGHTISFSHHKSKKKWLPNVQNKKVWSESLNDWVKFKLTTATLKGIDQDAGIDNYLMRLCDIAVADSNYLTKIRRIVGTAMFLQGKLDEKQIKRLGFDKQPPTEMPAKIEYQKDRKLGTPRIRKMRHGWVDPRY